MRHHKRMAVFVVFAMAAVLGVVFNQSTTENNSVPSVIRDYSTTPDWQIHTSERKAAFLQELTNVDRDSCVKWGVCATDLGIPFSLPEGETGYLFGDTFATAAPDSPGSGANWRSPVLLRSHSSVDDVVFDGASGLNAPGMAPEIVYNGHTRDGEFSVIPNDGITLPNGHVVVSYMSVNNWDITPNWNWATNYAGLALSTDGGHTFDRNAGPKWYNNADNSNAFQMQSLQMGSDGFVYLFGVPAGRQSGAMLLQRVPWKQILDIDAYQCWNGTDFGGNCKPLFTDSTAELSVRMLQQDGHDVWVMSYLSPARRAIVTRTAKSPEGPWSDIKVQLTDKELACMYGGFIDPRSTPDNLILTVSSWQRGPNGKTSRYNVVTYQGET